MKKILLTAFSLLAMATASAGIDGTYIAEKYSGYEVGNDYKFSSGSSWSSEATAEEGGTEEGDDADEWLIVVSNVEGNTYSVENLAGWDDVVTGTYDESAGTLTIKGGSVIYTDDSGIESLISGGLEGYKTAKGIMDYCDANNGWVAESRGLLDIVLKVDGNSLVAETPIFLYTNYYPGYGYHGIAISITASLECTKEADGINTVINEKAEGPVEYYNLQGIRLNNPANGQIVIKRQGNKVTKMIVR